MDIIEKRCSEGKCPICKCEEIKEKRTVEYKGKNITICKKHYFLNSKEVNEEIKTVRKERKRRKK